MDELARPRPNTTTHGTYSFDSIANNARITQNLSAARLSPMISAEPIPEVPMGATFGRLQQWLDELNDSQRDRLLQAMLRDRALNNERYATPATEEEDDIEVDGISPSTTPRPTADPRTPPPHNDQRLMAQPTNLRELVNSIAEVSSQTPKVIPTIATKDLTNSTGARLVVNNYAAGHRGRQRHQ